VGSMYTLVLISAVNALDENVHFYRLTLGCGP
jgi:hypothetical protein